MVNIVSFILLLIMVLLSVAFFTLMERSVLGYVHLRKGPNKVGVLGVFQPFADVISLFSKETNYMSWMNLILYLFIPLLSLILMLMFWVIFMWKFYQIDLEFGLIYFLCISSLGVYVILGGGWSSNSKYALLGSFRGLAQVISYEVSLAMIMIGLVLLSGSFNLFDIVWFQEGYWLMWGFMSMMILWVVSCLAETNRSPFDLSEGESELVSGFNIEYGSYGFAILFMSEYGNIIFMSMISSVMLLGGLGSMCWGVIMLMYIYLLVRGTLVRYRYDSLMMLAWKVILPSSIFILYLIFMLKVSFIFFICIKNSKDK
uniref:NADH-ubiquinone oxidoreductase chain 1 n=1 Tax=Ornithodoros tholozani TaxID=554291 RepID=A0A3G2JZZ0_9ACAR|nr:NADH dehydrogenase subunit 1 [Ornithodoros tholozani]AYN50610.1 NADH dehydrogenase subunit 1 [Ornithodoros tholozani]